MVDYTKWIGLVSGFIGAITGLVFIVTAIRDTEDQNHMGMYLSFSLPCLMVATMVLMPSWFSVEKRSLSFFFRAALLFGVTVTMFINHGHSAMHAEGAQQCMHTILSQLMFGVFLTWLACLFDSSIQMSAGWWILGSVLLFDVGVWFILIGTLVHGPGNPAYVEVGYMKAYAHASFLLCGSLVLLFPFFMAKDVTPVLLVQPVNQLKYVA